MFITKLSLPRRTFLRGMGAAVALPLLDAMVPALTALAQTRRACRARRFGAVYIPNGAIMEQWIPKAVGTGFEFSPILKPLEPFANVTDRGQQPHPAASGQPGGRPRRERRRLPDRRLAQTDGSRRRPRQHHHRSDRREADRPGHAVPVARGGDRRLHRLRRRLHAGLQLRLHEHHFVELADDAAADGDQSAGGVRADVRQAGHARRSAWRACATSGACSIRSPRKRTRCSAVSGTRDRVRVGEYLDNIREIERRIQRAEAHNNAEVTLDAPIGIPESFEEHVGADVRPAGAGLPGRRHARVHVHDVARAEPADLSRTSA